MTVHINVPSLCIKYNNCAANDPCAICGARTDPTVGPELFVEGTWSLVCYECAEQHAPQLLVPLLALRKAYPGISVAVEHISDWLHYGLSVNLLLDHIDQLAEVDGLLPLLLTAGRRGHDIGDILSTWCERVRQQEGKRCRNEDESIPF